VFKGSDYSMDGPAYDYGNVHTGDDYSMDGPAYDYGNFDDYEHPNMWDKNCQDKKSYCKRHKNYCHMNDVMKRFYKRYCKKTCGFCRDPVKDILDDYIMFDDNCQDRVSNCGWQVNHCYRDYNKRYCKRTCGLCHGQTPVRSVNCYDVLNFQYCSDVLRKELCYRHGKNCRRSCGLCDGMTQHPSNTCYDRANNCQNLVKACYQPNVRVNCKKTCGLCGGRTPLLSNHCWDEWTSCPRHAENDCFSLGRKRRKSCGLCRDMIPHPSNTCYDSSLICNEENKKYCDQPMMKAYCKKLCNLCRR